MFRKDHHKTTRALAALGTVIAAAGALAAEWSAAELESVEVWEPAAPGIRLRVWLPDGVRRLTPMTGHVEIYHDGPRSSRIRVEEVEVQVGDRVLSRVPADLVLAGDAGRYGEFNRLAELVAPDVSKRWVHRTLPLDAHRAFDPEESEAMAEELRALGRTMATDPTFAEAPPFGQVAVTVDPAELLSDRAGAKARLRFVVRYRDAGGSLRSASVEHVLVRRPDFPRAPLPVGGRGPLPDAAPIGEWKTGDLHVHDCKEETGFWRGCPSCSAETTDWGVQNTLAELKTQFVAAGADWFTSTSHSYCLEKEIEYEAVRVEASDLTTPDFLVIPDTELSSEESGVEGCFDYFDLICALPAGTNHMGAHFIQSYMPGGTDIFGGYCFRPMRTILENIDRIRDDGGLPIMNHPCKDFALGANLTSNSDEVLTGIRDGGLHATEIWNGPRQEGQAGHVRWWVERLLDGHKLYGCAGSDTHDDVFDFGWNHVYVWPELSVESLRRSIDRGLFYVSSYQYVTIAMREPGGAWVPMGGDLRIDRGSGQAPVVLAIEYDMGDRTGSIEVWRGRVGDLSESQVTTFANLRGDGHLIVTDEAPRDRDSYYRVYSVAPDPELDGVAYTNPVWVVPR